MGGKRQEVAFLLQTERTIPPRLALEPKGSPQSGLPTESDDRLASAETPKSPGNYLRPTAWATGTAAVASLGLAVFETTAYLGRKREFEQHVGPKADNSAEMGLNCGADD